MPSRLFLLWLQREQPRKAPDRIETAIRAGLRDARWPGRLEVIGQDPLTVIDVGHTPDGIRQSLASLMAIHGAEDWILVTGVSRDKKADEIVGALAPSFDTIICTAAHHKGADAEGIAAAAARANPAREPPCRRLDRGGGALWPGTGRRACSEEFMSPAGCSWRSNTRRSREAAAREDLQFF